MIRKSKTFKTLKEAMEFQYKLQKRRITVARAFGSKTVYFLE